MVEKVKVVSDSKYAIKVRAREKYLSIEGNTWEGWVKGRRNGTIKIG